MKKNAALAMAKAPKSTSETSTAFMRNRLTETIRTVNLIPDACGGEEAFQIKDGFFSKTLLTIPRRFTIMNKLKRTEFVPMAR